MTRRVRCAHAGGADPSDAASAELVDLVSRISTHRRVLLTGAIAPRRLRRASRSRRAPGTPMQNALREFYFMVSLVRPNYLGTPGDFHTLCG
jgi:hypothetical protein